MLSMVKKSIVSLLCGVRSSQTRHQAVADCFCIPLGEEGEMKIARFGDQCFVRDDLSLCCIGQNHFVTCLNAKATKTAKFFVVGCGTKIIPHMNFNQCCSIIFVFGRIPRGYVRTLLAVAGDERRLFLPIGNAELKNHRS